ncbi:MAG: low molecular weight protein-tyrosine-phosphatase [Solirubrobacteraceae bacterium]
MRILFVCSGNICRSPTAEGVMRHLLRERGMDGEVEVASAGIGGWHVGDPADVRSAEAARRRGISLDGAAQQVHAQDFDDYDLLVALDRGHERDLLAMAGEHRGKVRLLIDDADVPDPYYGGDDGFEDVLDLITEGCERLADEVAPLK